MATLGNTALQDIGALPGAHHLRMAVVRTAWNAHITEPLLAGCAAVLQQHHVKHDVYVVPGAVELTFAAQKLCRTYDAVIVLGCVIQGDTPHFDYVCQSVTQGITLLNTQADRPIIFGVLTVHTEAQALERIGGIHGHKGEEAALSALQMMAFRHQLRNTAI